MATIKVFLFSVFLTVLSLGSEMLEAADFTGEKAFLSKHTLSMEIAAEETAASKIGSSNVYASVVAIFKQHCVMCHTGPKAPDGLRLDSYQNVMAGSKSGPVVVPGNPAKSEILKRVKGARKPRMPMNGPPWLSDNEIAAIENWIKVGAPNDSSASQ